MSGVRAGARRVAFAGGYVADAILCNLIALFIVAPVVVVIEVLSRLSRLWNVVVEP